MPSGRAGARNCTKCSVMSREELARRFDMRLFKIFIGFAWAVLGLFVTVDRAYAVIPGTNGKIVFTGNQSGTWQLYTVNGDGSGLKQVTHMPKTNLESWFPAFSPDGKRILFTHDPPDNPCGQG